MRLGENDVLINPARAYLNLFNDLDKSIPAHERIAHWLGDELADAAQEGFETFLTLIPISPTAREIADSLAKSKYWPAACIIVAALAERFRQDIGFDDLTDERLMAGFFELRRGTVRKSTSIDGLEKTLENALHKRDAWSAAMRFYYEPQFEAQLIYVHALRTLMRDDNHATIVTELANDWLERFPDMAHAPELELITRLLRSGALDQLRRARERFTDISNAERRRNWDVIGILIEFEYTVAQLEASTVERDLLWHLEYFVGERTTYGAHIALSPLQLEWIISTFRPLWPWAEDESPRSAHNRTAHDASNHLIHFIRRLGSDAGVEA